LHLGDEAQARETPIYAVELPSWREVAKLAADGRR